MIDVLYLAASWKLRDCVVALDYIVVMALGRLRRKAKCRLVYNMLLVGRSVVQEN